MLGRGFFLGVVDIDGGSAFLNTCQTRVGKPCESGQLGAIDPDGRLIVLRLYEGQLKVGFGEGDGSAGNACG